MTDKRVSCKKLHVSMRKITERQITKSVGNVRRW